MPEHSAELLALHKAASLESIEYHELSARRTEGVNPGEEAVEVDPIYRLGVEVSESGDAYRLRLQVTLETRVGTIVAEAAAQYSAPDYEGELAQPLLIEYANEVAIMALIPYLRQAIADLTQRVFGHPLLMPVMGRGEVSFDVADAITTD